MSNDFNISKNQLSLERYTSGLLDTVRERQNEKSFSAIILGHYTLAPVANHIVSVCRYQSYIRIDNKLNISANIVRRRMNRFNLGTNAACAGHSRLAKVLLNRRTVFQLSTHDMLSLIHVHPLSKTVTPGLAAGF